jgi:hypothetical protein
MLFAVVFKDKPGQGALRAQQLQAHVRWLDDNRDWVLVGGSLREAPDDTPLGGLWVVEAESRNSVMERMATDPFWICGLRESVLVYHWNKAFPSRRVPV